MRVPAASVARSRAAARAWRDGAGYRRLAAAFGDVPPDADAIARRATRLFRADEWLADLLAPLIAGLAADPWFDPPVRTSRDALRSGAMLFESPVVAVGVAVLSAERLRALSAPAMLVVSGRLSVTRYLRAGGAILRRWRVPPVPEPCVATAMGRSRPCRARRLSDGMIVRHDGRVHAHVLAAARSDVVTLTATVRTGGDAVAREYDAVTGAFVRLATNDDGAARAQVLLSLLRASAAAGADACFDAATRDAAFFLRWSAMREWLAHDARAAWPRLIAMADRDPHPEVRAAAAATVAQLTRRAA